MTAIHFGILDGRLPIISSSFSGQSIHKHLSKAIYQIALRVIQESGNGCNGRVRGFKGVKMANARQNGCRAVGQFLGEEFGVSRGDNFVFCPEQNEGWGLNLV
jgi:hypothetical protein